LEPDRTKTKQSLENQSKISDGIPNKEFRIAIFSLPLWWFSIFVAVFTRAAHFLNKRSNLHSELATIIVLGVPILVFVFLWVKNSWFRKRAVIIGLVWLLTPLVIQQLGMTQGTFIRAFGDSWATEHP
jgi:hypothetical protein